MDSPWTKKKKEEEKESTKKSIVVIPSSLLRILRPALGVMIILGVVNTLLFHSIHQQQQQNPSSIFPNHHPKNYNNNNNDDNALSESAEQTNLSNEEEMATQLENKENSNEEVEGEREQRKQQSATDNPDEQQQKQQQQFSFDRSTYEQTLQQHGSSRFRKPITAFLEPPMDDVLAYHLGDPLNKSDKGQPPEWRIPLPLRTTTPQDLQRVEYPHKFQTCNMPTKTFPASQLPVDRGLLWDDQLQQPIVWNLQNQPEQDSSHNSTSSIPPETPQHCPVNADPFLPWIHDMVVSTDGAAIHFVAQNKRKCNTGSAFLDSLLKELAPQTTLFQPIGVQRITQGEAQLMAPQMYQASDQTTGARYRLADYGDAGAPETRFICQFFLLDANTGDPALVDETLSYFPFNYEFVSWRRVTQQTMITPKGAEKANPLTSTLLFTCPVPSHLQTLVRSGQTVLSDGTPTLRLDLIPIRTSPRYGLDEVHFTEDTAGPKSQWHQGNHTSASLWRSANAPLRGFDFAKRIGNRHVLPLAEASGRWSHLPICQPETVGRNEKKEEGEGDEKKRGQEDSGKDGQGRFTSNNRPYELVACTWASASYATRGPNQPATNSSLLRLQEWLEFHLMVGFDHIYVYDNSAANTKLGSLQSITDKFPPSRVTRVEWPHVVCNNNIPEGPNPGERSSQYAAENSCRVRYGNLTDWMASFDVDEYMVPMGNHTNLKDVLRHIPDRVSIVDLRSSRTRLRYDATVPVNKRLRDKDPQKTYLESYNCDTVPPPKPYTADRARKEIYRPQHVLYHFVHYSLVTQTSAVRFKDAMQRSEPWGRFVWETVHFPEYVPSEVTEATMLHAKGGREGQSPWKVFCQAEATAKRSRCPLGFPWPPSGNDTKYEDQFYYNCHENKRVREYWLPRLQRAMEER